MPSPSLPGGSGHARRCLRDTVGAARLARRGREFVRPWQGSALPLPPVRNDGVLRVLRLLPIHSDVPSHEIAAEFLFGGERVVCTATLPPTFFPLALARSVTFANLVEIFGIMRLKARAQGAQRQQRARPKTSIEIGAR